MAIARRPHVILEFEVGADPLRGTIERADGTRQAFWGWLELMEELQRVAGAGPESPPTRTDKNHA